MGCLSDKAKRFIRRAADALRCRWHHRLLKGRLARFQGRTRFSREDIWRLHAVFGRHAPWDVTRRAREKRAREFLRKAERFGSFKGCRFLDVGTGHGSYVNLAVRRGAELGVGVDVNFHPETRNEWKELGARGIFIKAPAEELPFRDDSFDMIHTNSIEHFPDPHTAVEEMVRVARPGGFILLFIGGFYHSPEASHLYSVINVPWSALLFDHDVLCDAFRLRSPSPEHTRKFITAFRELNGLSVDDYKAVVDRMLERCALEHYQEHVYDYYVFNVVLETFPEIFSRYPRRWLVTDAFDAVLQKQ